MNLKIKFRLYDSSWHTIYESSDLFGIDIKDLKKLYKKLSGFVAAEIRKIIKIVKENNGKDK